MLRYCTVLRVQETMLGYHCLTAVQPKNFPSNHESKAEISLMARQTMKRKTSIAPCHSETDGTLLSLERSREAVCPSVRLSHVLTTHSSDADSNRGITVRSANNSVGTEQPSGLGHRKRKDVTRNFMKPLYAGESSASRSRLFTFCEKSICST